MRLHDYVAPELIALGVQAHDKRELLHALVAPLVESGRVRDPDVLIGELLKREDVMSTGIGGGIAIPHALATGVDDLVLVFGRTAVPMEFQAADGQPVDLVFMLVGPKDASSLYVKLLARVSRLLQSEDFKERLRQSPDAEDVLEALRAEEE